MIDRAHTEANGVLNGVGLVKLMGREAGYIAAAATIASGDVNFTLIPELPFQLDGTERLAGQVRAPAGRASACGDRRRRRGRSGSHPRARKKRYDASGNRVLADIGSFLKRQITDHFETRKLPITVRYFDPSYSIRSCPANTTDSLLCERLARSAAHAAMAGKTDVLIGLWHEEFVHVPLAAAAGQHKRLSPEDECWTTVLAMTGQEKW